MKRGLGKSNKSAQHTMGLPFGIIFAIFLIIVFIVIAFVAIKYFLDIGSCSGVGMFYDELQRGVDDVWATQESNREFEMDLPSGVMKICFGNLTGEISQTDEVLDDYGEISIYKYQDANVFLSQAGEACEMQFSKIEHINITKITENRNPYCVDVSRGLVLKKGFYDKFVVVE